MTRLKILMLHRFHHLTLPQIFSRRQATRTTNTNTPPTSFIYNFALKPFDIYIYIYTSSDHAPWYFLIEVSLSGYYYHMLLLSGICWQVLYCISSSLFDTLSLYVNTVVWLAYRADYMNRYVCQGDSFLLASLIVYLVPFFGPSVTDPNRCCWTLSLTLL